MSKFIEYVSPLLKVFIDKFLLGFAVAVSSWTLGVVTNKIQTEPVINNLKETKAELKEEVANLEWGIEYYRDPDFY